MRMNFQVWKHKGQMLKERNQNKKVQNKTIKHKLKTKQNPVLVLHFSLAGTHADTPSVTKTDGAGLCSVSRVVLPSSSRLLFPSPRHWCCLLGTTSMYLLNSFPCLHDAYKTNKRVSLSGPLVSWNSAWSHWGRCMHSLCNLGLLFLSSSFARYHAFCIPN